MQKITVNASRVYDILIGRGLLPRMGSLIAAQVKGRSACLVSDSNVWPLHGAAAVKSLEEAGFSVHTFVFPAGEESKNAQTYLSLLSFLAQRQLTREDCLVALGGGVTGDLTGFAAATYLRGVPYVQVPTTLLAAVDSSVGGKTAIDLPEGKNLAGCFYQPSLVLCDIRTLKTLPQEVFLEGCAEVIKYGILYDRPLFDYLKQEGMGFDREQVIRRCVELKRNVVARDEFDTGARMQLNLGHTVGHAIEALSGFTVSHGHAVAMGTAIVSRAAAKNGLLPQEAAQAIEEALDVFRLPTATAYPAEALTRHMLSDKKRAGDRVNLIVPRAIGRCEILPIPVEQLTDFVGSGL